MSDGRNGQSSAWTLKRRLLSGGAWTIAARVTAGLSGFMINALLSRLLSPEDVGAYFLLVSVASVGAIAAQLGLQLAVVRLVAEAIAGNRPGHARGLIRRALGLTAVSAVVAGGLVGFAGEAGVVAIFGSATLAQVAWLAGFWLVSLSLTGVVAEAFRGLHDYGMAGALGGAGTNLLLLTVLIVVFTLHLRMTLFDVVALGTLTVFATAVVGLAAMRRRLRRLGPSSDTSAGELLSVSLPLLVTTVSIFISTQADIWILGIQRGNDEVAMYGTAVRLVQMVLMPLLMMNAILAPVISEQFSQGRRAALERVLRGCAAITGLPALLALVFIAVAAEPMLGRVYGEYYKGGATVLLLVSAGQTVNVLSGSAAVVLMMTGHQRAAMTISAATGLGLIAGALLVVDRHGIDGVAAVAGSMTALHGVLCAVWVRRATGMWTYCSFAALADFSREFGKILRTAFGR